MERSFLGRNVFPKTINFKNTKNFFPFSRSTQKVKGNFYFQQKSFFHSQITPRKELNEKTEKKENNENGEKLDFAEEIRRRLQKIYEESDLRKDEAEFQLNAEQIVSSTRRNYLKENDLSKQKNEEKKEKDYIIVKRPF